MAEESPLIETVQSLPLSITQASTGERDGNVQNAERITVTVIPSAKTAEATNSLTQKYNRLLQVKIAAVGFCLLT